MDLRFHHVAEVVENILEKYRYYRKLGFEIKEGFIDPLIDQEQKVTVGVVALETLIIELLEPLNSDSPVYAFCKKGGGLHHICYQTTNLKQTIKEIEESHTARRISLTTISVWDKHPVVFFFSKDNQVFELIEIHDNKKK